MTEEDHDILIELKTEFDTKIKTLCSTISELKNNIKELNKNTINYQKEIEKRPKWNHLITIFICLIGLVGGIIGYNFNQDVRADDKINKLNNKVIKYEEVIKLFKK